jgi:hypothetical protein
MVKEVIQMAPVLGGIHDRAFFVQLLQAFFSAFIDLRPSEERIENLAQKKSRLVVQDIGI